MASANVGAETGAFEDVGAPAPTPGAHSSGVALCVPTAMAVIVSLVAAFI